MFNTSVIRLLRTYDAEKLKQDLAAVEEYQMASQPGGYHDGGWKGLSLYAQGGDLGFAGPRRSLSETYEPTAILDHTPYIRSILDGLDAPKQSVRLLALLPGRVIGEHRDDPMSLRAGVIRLHVPIVTHPDVELMLDGQRIFWGEGELWYADFTKLHSVANRSPITRIHLVMDLELTEALLALFPPELLEQRDALGISVRGKAEALSPETLERYGCRFLFPPGVVPYFEQGFEGEVMAADGQLAVAVAANPSFLLVPVGEHRFEIAGFGAGTYLQYAFDAGRLQALDLVIGGGEQVIPMTLLPEPESVRVS